MSAKNFAKIPEELLYDISISPYAVRLYGVLQRYAGKSGECISRARRIGREAGDVHRDSQAGAGRAGPCGVG